LGFVQPHNNRAFGLALSGGFPESGL